MAEAPQTAPNNRYTTIAIVLHWVIAIVLLAQLFYGLTMEDLPRAERFAAMQSHKSMGLTIFGLVLLRILWRVANPPPALDAHLKPVEKKLAHATHFGFYALMLGLPITGYVLISTAPYKIATKFWGLFSVPVLPLGGTSFGHGLHEVAEKAHGLFAYVMLLLLALHVAGALKHQFIDRDNNLARMLPFLAKK